MLIEGLLNAVVMQGSSPGIHHTPLRAQASPGQHIAPQSRPWLGDRLSPMYWSRLTSQHSGLGCHTAGLIWNAPGKRVEGVPANVPRSALLRAAESNPPWDGSLGLAALRWQPRDEGRTVPQTLLLTRSLVQPPHGWIRIFTAATSRTAGIIHFPTDEWRRLVCFSDSFPQRSAGAIPGNRDIQHGPGSAPLQSTEMETGGCLAGRSHKSHNASFECTLTTAHWTELKALRGLNLPYSPGGHFKNLMGNTNPEVGHFL